MIDFLFRLSRAAKFRTMLCQKQMINNLYIGSDENVMTVDAIMVFRFSTVQFTSHATCLNF